MERNKYTNAQRIVIILLATGVIYFLLESEAAASEALNLFPATLPPVPVKSGQPGNSVVSLQIVLNSLLDH